MEDYKKFYVDLLGPLKTGDNWQFDIDSSFFGRIDGVIERGDIKTEVVYDGCIGGLFNFTVHSEGTVIVPCDRCLADVELRIDTTDVLAVRLGADYSDDGECVVVPEDDGLLDLSLLIYEFIVLSMPIKRTHEPGMCDVVMMDKFSEHQVARSNQEEDAEYMDSEISDVCVDSDDAVVDERWEALKKLINK
jgi:uncharacterized metal-binding protein YceD (DUF177 family)